MIGLLKTSLTFILISDMASPMRVHAVGPTNPNIDPHYGRIPALDQKRIIWDGIPRPDFEEVFFEYLMYGLGTISENGYTLLTTAFGNDAGGFGPLAIPTAAGASPQILQQHTNRNTRLFCCLMTYIVAG